MKSLILHPNEVTTISAQAEMIRRLREDGEGLAPLAENWIEEMDVDMEPIRLHTALMTEVEKESVETETWRDTMGEGREGER